MNERIRELADKAEDYADSIVDQGGEFHLAYTQKLTELIVRECAQVIQAQNDDDNDLDSWDRGFVAGLATAIDAIEQHFGVES